MALLIFPSSPVSGQLFPVNPLADQYQYKWSAADITWRLLGAATGVVPGTYCTSPTSVARFTVDAVGRITFAECFDLGQSFVKLNNTAAYNNYVWPNSDGNPGEVLVTNGFGDLFWAPQSGGGGGGSGTVTFVGAGNGLAILGGGGGITTAGTIILKPATTTSLGGVIPDGTTVTISPTGVISAAVAPVGLGLTVNGGFSKVSIPTSSTPPVEGTGQLQAVPGSLYWDNTLGELFIYYDDGTTSQWISTTGGAPPTPPAAGYGLIEEISAYKASIPALTAPPSVGTAANQATEGSMYYDNLLGVMFYLYNDGVSTQWVQV
jgi:hypothetical protein